jgi:acylphosphatase
MSQAACRLLRIRGRVQGVGFRAFVQDEAMRLDLRGWVRNRRDGSVEALVVGEDAAVEKLTVQLRNGPPGARVSGVDARESTPEALTSCEGGFEILATM